MAVMVEQCSTKMETVVGKWFTPAAALHRERQRRSRLPEERRAVWSGDGYDGVEVVGLAPRQRHEVVGCRKRRQIVHGGAYGAREKAKGR